MFSFDMSEDPLTTDASALVGNRLDVLLVKVNGGLYYETSTHMDGLQKRMGETFTLVPAQCLYVQYPTEHHKDAEVQLSTNGVQKLQYVAVGIPSSLVRDKQVWSMPLQIGVHLPSIREVDELPQTAH